MKFHVGANVNAACKNVPMYSNKFEDNQLQ